MTHNHANYQSRLDFIQNLLREQFSLEKDVQIAPLQYDPECPFKYNNFVYRLTLPTSVDSALNVRPLQAGTVRIPKGTKDFILRLTNSDAEGMNQVNRVENEVAIISLAASALVGFKPHIVPQIYGWGSAATADSQGWILQKFMSGKPLDEAFENMDIGQKQSQLAQMAQILKALQTFKLPDSITEYGGVTFDPSGRIVSAPMVAVGGGPWPSFQEHFSNRLQVALQKTDASPYIKGWKANGVRQRLDTFADKGLAARFASFNLEYEKAIVHADFTPNNILFDETTQCITALLDYDFACIQHPSYEFFRSFGTFSGRFQAPSVFDSSEEREQIALQSAKLHGFPSPLTPPVNGSDVDWKVARAWEEELEKLDVKRPSTMKGIKKVAEVDALLDAILPWRLDSGDVLELQSEEAKWKCREESEAKLVKLLDHFGF